MAENCPACGHRADGYDALMAELRDQRAYGSLTITLKDGETGLITLNRTFKAPAEALKSARAQLSEAEMEARDR